MRRLDLPSFLVSEPFLVRDAVELAPYERLRQPGIVLLARGLRASAVLAAQRDPVHYERLLGRRQHLSHTTAAALWGMPLPDDPLVHTTTVGSGSVTRRPGFVGHRVAPGRARVDVVRGVAVTARVDAWAECSTLLTVEQLVVAGDFLVGKHCRLDVAELTEAVGRRRGLRGAKKLVEALALVRVGSESPRETRLRLQLLREGVRPPLLNCVIHDVRDRFVARPDLIFGYERVVVEYDGDKHRTDRTTYRDDKRRREVLADAGWHALYVSDDDLTGANWSAFVDRLRRALARGASIHAPGEERGL